MNPYNMIEKFYTSPQPIGIYSENSNYNMNMTYQTI